ncbi:MAG: hypothetical protein WBO36_12445, partial [Saprospiraceae bacterium]
MSKTQVLFCFIVMLGAMTAPGCKKKGPPDGNYCAKVQFNHPETKRPSTLTIIAEVKDNKAVDFSFPEGYPDTCAIKPTFIPEDGKFTAVSARGIIYKVEMIGDAEKCLKAQNMLQCKGLSKDGNRCKRFTD